MRIRNSFLALAGVFIAGCLFNDSLSELKSPNAHQRPSRESEILSDSEREIDLSVDLPLQETSEVVATNPPMSRWPELVGKRIALHGPAYGPLPRVVCKFTDTHGNEARLLVIVPSDKSIQRRYIENSAKTGMQIGPIHVEGILQNVHMPAHGGQQGNRWRPEAMDHFFVMATQFIYLNAVAQKSERQTSTD